MLRTINNGTVVINRAAGLGTSLTPITINGSTARFAGGGSLVLDGNSGFGPLTVTRDITIQGYGPSIASRFSTTPRMSASANRRVASSSAVAAATSIFSP